VALDCERWQWRELVASEHGPPDPGTRHVLLTLALHMNQLGDSCFPSQDLIVKRTGLSERSVRKHLKLAQQQQWIEVRQKRRQGQAWFSHEYAAIIPDELAQYCTSKPWEDDPTWRRPAESAARSKTQGFNGQHPANGAGHPATGAERPATENTTPGNLRHDARHQLPLNSSSNASSKTSNNTPEKVLAAPRVLDLQIEKQDPEAEKRISAAAKEKAEAAAKYLTEGVLRAKKLLTARPDDSDAEIARAARTTVEHVQMARRLS
jgi:hypothetical protein